MLARRDLPRFGQLYPRYTQPPGVLPWQMNKTLIFINFLLVEFEMPHFAHVFGFLFDKRNVDLLSGHSTLCTYKGKSRQNKSKCYTQTDTNRIRISDKSIRLKMGVIVKK